jgi:ankyrin repeat protein
MEKTLATVNNRIVGLSGGVYCRLYKALVDHHELVFRIPIQPTSTPSATPGSTAIAGAVRSPSLNTVTASASVNLAFQKYQPSSATPAVSGGTGGAGYRMPTIPDSDDDDDDDGNGNYNRPIRYIKETDLVDSDDDDPEVLANGDSHAHQHAHGDSPGRYQEEDTDNQQRDYNQRLKSRATNVSRVSRYTQANLTQILQEVEKWVIPIAGSLTDEDDDFPSSEYDILHVQYLAAARGSWEEAVGMRRHNLGFTDEHVSILLEQQYTPIHLAAYLGNLKIVRQLVEDVGLPPHICDANNESPLHLACKRGHLSMIRYLVEECELDALQENSQGVTPIQYALKGGYLEVVVYFIEETPAEQKIPLDFQDSVLKGSLLHWACLGKRVELVEYLIVTQNIAVETIAESDKSTCLLWAALGSTVEVVKFLIENASADPNVCNAQGWTCLHMATASGDVDKTIYLIENARLKITEKNANHKTPYEVANGAAAIYLQERKKKGFVSGSIVDKAKKRKSSVKSK